MPAFNDIIHSGNFLVLDTETTGLGPTKNDRRIAEICQIAVIDATGRTLLDTLVKPVKPIPPDATRIHKITDDMVATAPGWGEVSQQLLSILKGKHVVIYNAIFDRRLMHQAAEQAQVEKIDWKEMATFHCAMLKFAPIFGEWVDWSSDYKWQSLATAAAYYEFAFEDAHTALGDCLMTLQVCRAMAAAEQTKK